ncbi:MAG: 50S ribosomal protein L5 [Nanoarchaeota archaeon]|nr:50S ribosomal protein L5 [Nanoarchaeota archaeon]
MNKMREIRIEKITLNIGAGKDQKKLDNGVALLKNLTGIAPVKTKAKKRIPEWGLRVGVPIGCKLTLRGKEVPALIKRLLEAKEFHLQEKQFTDEGTISFGIPEYIDIGEMKYDPEIGIMGLEVCITLERPGFRIKRRVYQKKKIPKSHKISKEESISFFKEQFNVKVGEVE